jgi:L-fucose mutarotase
MPLDQFVDSPAAVMQRVDEPSEAAPVWSKFQEACDASEGKDVTIERVERFAFYERAKTCYGVIATGETALYGNIIIKKGVLTADQQTVV